MILHLPAEKDIYTRELFEESRRLKASLKLREIMSCINHKIVPADLDLPSELFVLSVWFGIYVRVEPQKIEWIECISVLGEPTGDVVYNQLNEDALISSLFLATPLEDWKRFNRKVFNDLLKAP